MSGGFLDELKWVYEKIMLEVESGSEEWRAFQEDLRREGVVYFTPLDLASWHTLTVEEIERETVPLARELISSILLDESNSRPIDNPYYILQQRKALWYPVRFSSSGLPVTIGDIKGFLPEKYVRAKDEFPVRVHLRIASAFDRSVAVQGASKGRYALIIDSPRGKYLTVIDLNKRVLACTCPFYREHKRGVGSLCKHIILSLFVLKNEILNFLSEEEREYWKDVFNRVSKMPNPNEPCEIEPLNRSLMHEIGVPENVDLECVVKCNIMYYFLRYALPEMGFKAVDLDADEAFIEKLEKALREGTVIEKVRAVKRRVAPEDRVDRNDPISLSGGILRGIVKLMVSRYGLEHEDSAKTLLLGMLMGVPVISIGTHGHFKTSKVRYLASLFFDKNVYLKKDILGSQEQVREEVAKVARLLGYDEERFIHNLERNVNVEYEILKHDKIDGTKLFRVRIRLPEIKDEKVKERLIKELAWSVDEREEPIRFVFAQVKDKTRVEDVFGWTNEEIAYLHDLPPHLVKKGKACDAQILLIDEAFANPIFLSALHKAMNEGLYSTSLGDAILGFEFVVLTTNPINRYYGTNVDMVNFATLDRYGLATFTDHVLSSSLLHAMEKFKDEPKPIIPLDTLRRIRMLVDKVKIPSEIINFISLLTTAFSVCFFTTSESDLKSVKPRDPFLFERYCESCVFGESGCYCSKAVFSKPRAFINLVKAIKAHALYRGSDTANEEDLAWAIEHVLPHRMQYSEAVMERHGNDMKRAFEDALTSFLKEYKDNIGIIEETFEKKLKGRIKEEDVERLKASHSPLLKALALELERELYFKKESIKLPQMIKTKRWVKADEPEAISVPA